jgi:hypothetical protein
LHREYEETARGTLDFVRVRKSVLDVFGRSYYVIRELLSGRTRYLLAELVENTIEQRGAIGVDQTNSFFLGEYSFVRRFMQQ